MIVEKIQRSQMVKIYAIGTQLGIYEKNNPNDNLHAMVFSITGKTSIASLTNFEANNVIKELARHNRGKKEAFSGKPSKNRPGMATAEQSKKVWALMYRIAEHDKEPSKLTLGFRLSKIIEKELKLIPFNKEIFTKDPLQFVNFEQARKLIEVLKGYVNNEKRKKLKQTRDKGIL